jgi:DNA-binding NarL/FixJ family response regulator
MIHSPTSIAIVEDDPSLRKILADVLDGSPDWELAGVFADAETALLAIPHRPPKVVLMDIQLPGMSGIECVARLKETYPDIHVMMVTVYDNNDRIFEALAAGAIGYLLKRDVPDKLLQSLGELLDGDSPMSAAIARKVVQHFRKTPPSENQDHNLTPRETEILNHLVNGSLYKEIALDVGIGYETVRTHLRRIYSKLQVRTRTEAVVKYLGRS